MDSKYVSKQVQQISISFSDQYAHMILVVSLTWFLHSHNSLSHEGIPKIVTPAALFLQQNLRCVQLRLKLGKLPVALVLTPPIMKMACGAFIQNTARTASGGAWALEPPRVTGFGPQFLRIVGCCNPYFFHLSQDLTWFEIRHRHSCQISKRGDVRSKNSSNKKEEKDWL